MTESVRIREWSRLLYYDPEPAVIALAKLGANPRLQDLPYREASLRTHELRPYFERRLGALFFFLMGKAINAHVKFAHVENADYDFVGHYEYGDEQRYVPVQMKELVPDFLNPKATLRGLIESLRKYVDSEDLTVAINVNRIGTIRPEEIDVSGLKLRSLWLFGASMPDQSEWIVIGDLMKPNWNGARFNHPHRPWHLD